MKEQTRQIPFFTTRRLIARFTGKLNVAPWHAACCPGVMRAELVPQLRAEERTLRPEDRLAADQLLVTDSVREVLRAQLTDLTRANMQECSDCYLKGLRRQTNDRES